MPKTTAKVTKKPAKKPSSGRTSLKKQSKKQLKKNSIFERGEKTTLLEELFLSLSLSPDEERKLVEDIFVAALKRNICGDGHSGSHRREDKLVIQTNSEGDDSKFRKADEKLVKVLGKSEDDVEDTPEGGDYSNLKYGKSKYKNVESILKYVETPDDKGGVKLVIMNFND